MNVILRGVAESVGMVLGVLSTIWLTRTIGPSLFGYYAVMVAIVGLGGLLINAGLSASGSQRVANDPASAGEVLWMVTVSRALIAAVALVGGMGLLAVVPVDAVLGSYLRVGLLSWAFIPLRSEWALVAQGRVRALSVVRIAAAAATLLTAVLLVRDVSDADRAPWILVAGAVVTGAGSALLAHLSTPYRRPAVTRLAGTFRAYLRDGVHYFKADVSTFIVTSSDRLFLYVFATPTVVGLYEAAYRVIQPFYVISAVVGDAMYLQLARTIGTDQLRLTLRRYVDLMCFATVPLGFFLLAFSAPVILTLYGSSYAGASQYLAALGWVITFGYTAGVAVIPFTAWNLAREYGNATGLGGALNLGLNAALIPSFKALGAAWATVAAKIAVTVIGLRNFRRATDYPLVTDFAEYFGISAVAFCVALAATQLLPHSSVSGMLTFGLVYVTLVAMVRWRGYIRRPKRQSSVIR